MKTPADQGIEFKPNRSKKNLSTFYWILGLVMAFCLVPIIVGLQNSNIKELDFHDSVGAGLALFGCCLLFFLIAHYLTSPFNVHYVVSKQGITLTAFRTTRFIPYSEIESVTYLTELQTEQIILKGWNHLKVKQSEAIRKAPDVHSASPETLWGTITSVFKLQTTWFDKYKFLSVAIGFSGSARSQVAQSADIPCDTVLILLKNGEGYFISPLDIPGFMEEAKKYFRD